MFYLTTHSTHFVYGYMEGKVGNVLFNDTFNTFYLRLYGVRHMVKDHTDSERGIPLPPHGLSFQLAARVLLYASSHRQDNTFNGFCYTSCGVLAGTRNSSMVHPMKDRSDDPSHHKRTLLPRSYISLLSTDKSTHLQYHYTAVTNE